MSAESTAHSTTDHGSADEEILIETTPTTRPTMVKALLTAVIAGALIGYLSIDPEILGSFARANIATLVIGGVLVILEVRYVIELFVLTRTRYIVTPAYARREYRLLMRRKEREVPFSRVRSHELEQGRIEAILGFGSIALNQGLGTLRLDYLPNPDEVYDVIQTHI